MHITHLLLKKFSVGLFLIFIVNLTLNAGSHLLLKDSAFLRHGLKSFQPTRNISFKTWLYGGVDVYEHKPQQKCHFEDFKIPLVDPLTVDSVHDFTRENCANQFLYLEISAFRRSDGSTAINQINQKMLHVAAEQFAARKKRVLFLDEDFIEKAPDFHPYDAVIINNLYFLRACGWGCNLNCNTSSFLQRVLLSNKKVIVASYEPLSIFRNDVMLLDKMINERLAKDPDLKQYLLGLEKDS